MVSTGHDSIPHVAELPGHFDGLQLHTHDYRTPDVFADSRLPWALRRRAAQLLFRLSAGDAVKAGIPEPPARCCDKPNAVSDELVKCVRRGEPTVSAPVLELRPITS